MHNHGRIYLADKALCLSLVGCADNLSMLAAKLVNMRHGGIQIVYHPDSNFRCQIFLSELSIRNRLSLIKEVNTVFTGMYDNIVLSQRII